MMTGRRGFLRLFLLWAGSIACTIPQQRAAKPNQPVSTLISTSTPPQQEDVLPTDTASPIVETVKPSPPPEPAFSPTPGLAEPPALFVIDGHEDIAWNALEFDRDPLLSAFDIREAEKSTPIPYLIGERTTGYPEWTAGKIGVIFATIFVMPERHGFQNYNKMSYSNPQEAQEKAREQLAYYQELASTGSRFQILRSKNELDAVVSNWQRNIPDNPAIGLVLCLEGADPILLPEDLPAWHEAGLRIIGPAWAKTRYAGGTYEPGPLSDLGRQLLETMGKLNMVLDLSHLAEEAYYQSIDEYPGTMIASHSNPRKFLPTERGLSDEMIRLLVDRDGVVGINLYNRFLKPGWVEGNAREEINLDTVAAAIDHVTQLAGSAAHAAIGSDIDGGFGRGSIPYEMDSAADLIKIAEALQKWGYSESNIRNIMNGNWLRVLNKSLA